MDSLIAYIKLYEIEIAVGAALLSLVSFILILMNYARTNKLLKKYKKLTRGVHQKNLEAVLMDHLARVDQVVASSHEFEDELKQLELRLKACIQRVSVIRYNPFEHMGSDQSYSIALMDDQKNGVVLTGLFGRTASTTYAKPVVNGTSAYPLSDEEKKVIASALQQEL